MTTHNKLLFSRQAGSKRIFVEREDLSVDFEVVDAVWLGIHDERVGDLFDEAFVADVDEEEYDVRRDVLAALDCKAGLAEADGCRPAELNESS